MEKQKKQTLEQLKKNNEVMEIIAQLMIGLIVMSLVVALMYFSAKKDHENKMKECMKTYSEEYCYAVVR